MDSVRPPGPRAEKDATMGAGLNSLTSSVGRITAVGFLKPRNIDRTTFTSISLLVTTILDTEKLPLGWVTHLVELM